jgi:hypothetical protein
MFGVKRSAAVAVILSIWAVGSAASAEILDVTGAKHETVAYAEPHLGGYARDVYAADPGSQSFDATQGFTKDVGKPTLWAMLIVGFAHLGVSLRCRAAALRLQPMLARRKRRQAIRTRGRQGE